MLYWEIIAVCSHIHRKDINTLCGQNLGLLKVKPGGIYSNHCALESCSSTLGTDDCGYNYYLTKKKEKHNAAIC